MKQDAFRPGERIEFRSGEHGGCWKPGVVVELLGENHCGRNVRICVGAGVWVIRPVKKCRRVEADGR